MPVSQFNLETNQRAERKKLITVAEWKEGTTTVRTILGRRTEDSSVEYNANVETLTDVLGITYTEVEYTQPQQTFDAHPIMGGDRLGEKIDDIRRRNAVSEYSQFTVYLIEAYKGTSGAYEAECHQGCTIYPSSLGGDSKVNMPLEVHLSNNYNDTGAPGLGTVDKLTDDFVFTPATVG